MWHEPQQHPPKCSVEHLQSSSQRGPGEGSSRILTRRCAPQSPSRRPFLHFPPPPKHPPPHSVNPRMSEDHLLSVPGPSTARQPHEPSWEIPNDYSYAYYEPGPAKKHTNIPSKYPGGAARDVSFREGSYRSKHTYLTRYGTEENIYEEISEVTRARMHAAAQQHQQSIISLNQSLVEEEVRRVQSGHRRVLGELNLSVEAMLMPNSREGSDDTDRETDDQLADLLSVGPTDELLSPIPPDLDSGFSGSSSGASYRSAAGSLRRGPDRNKCNNVGSKTPNLDTTPSKSFWNRKGWKKLAGFSGSSSQTNKQQVVEIFPKQAVFSLEQLEEEIVKHKPVVLFITHGESSTGLLQPLLGLGDICHKKRIRSIKVKPPFYYNLLALFDVWKCFDQHSLYHYTYNSNLLFAAREGLSEIAEEGILAVCDKNKKLSQQLWDGLEKLGFEFVVENPENRLWTITCVYLPSDLSWSELNSYLTTKYKLFLGRKLGLSNSRVFRIGIMGYNAREEVVQYVLDKLKEVILHYKKR